MSIFQNFFNLDIEGGEQLSGVLKLDSAINAQGASEELSYRSGKVIVGDRAVELSLVHSTASEKLVYLHKVRVNHQLSDLLGLQQELGSELLLPGQLLLGSARTQVMGACTRDAVRNPSLVQIISENKPDKIAIFPIFREGIRYQVAEAIYAVYGNFYNEIMVDAHHVADKSIPGYNRRVGSVKFFDRDVTDEEMSKVNTAIIADSISGGVVLLGVLEALQQRCPNLSRIEVIAQFATLRGLARLAAYTPPRFSIRVHAFETILHSLAPNYYYAAHFMEPEMHIAPHLESEYQDWWGEDRDGKKISSSLCAGFGWSFVYFTPEKQVQVINKYLQEIHKMSLVDIINRNMR
jgi:hypothetical protein